MFKDVQELKLAEMNNQLEQLKNKVTAMKSDVENLNDKLFHLNERLKHLQRSEKSKSFEFGGGKFSILERLINKQKRERYHIYLNAIDELKFLPNKISRLSSELEIAKMQTADKIKRSGILQEIKTVEDVIYKINNAKCLADVDMTPTDAMEVLEINGITPVLDESDRAIFERPRNYQSKADLIAVHKMDVVPTNNRLLTLKEAGVQRVGKVILDGKGYTYNYLLERNTVHISMNDEVSSHEGGNWDKCHYTVLQPFDEIPNEKIGMMLSNDTFTRGGFDLTKNAWILCPVKEVETVKKLNPNVHVLGYNAENSYGLAAPFLSQLGYRAESVGAWGWADEQSEQQFGKLAKQEKLNMVQHNSTTDYEDEDFLIQTNKAIAIVKMLVENNLIQSPLDWERIKPQLEDQINFSCLLCGIWSSTRVFPEFINDTAVVANKRQVIVLAEKMAQAGMPLTQHEQNTLQTQIDDFKRQSLVELVTKILLNSAVRSYNKNFHMFTDTDMQPSVNQSNEQINEADSTTLWF